MIQQEGFQNKRELMDELAKIRRVLGRINPASPHNVVLVLDATTGQNALSQIEIFKEVAGVTGLVMTKLDGTARGGVLWLLPPKNSACPFTRSALAKRLKICGLSIHRKWRSQPQEHGHEQENACGGSRMVSGCPRLCAIGALLHRVQTARRLQEPPFSWLRSLKQCSSPNGNWAEFPHDVVIRDSVIVFGSLTLYLRDPKFIQIKPTIIYTILSALLFGGLLCGRALLKTVLEHGYDGLSDRGWLLLSRNWAWFFAAMAIVNELLRRSVGFDAWLTIKVWGVNT